MPASQFCAFLRRLVHLNNTVRGVIYEKKIFPKVLGVKLFLVFHTMQKFSTLKVDWLDDTHGQG